VFLSLAQAYALYAQIGALLHPATADELAESIAAARVDGGAGVICVDGRTAYVVGDSAEARVR
jgi:hypothetical protein